jgi:hypothetical protein
MKWGYFVTIAVATFLWFDKEPLGAILVALLGIITLLFRIGMLLERQLQVEDEDE